MGARHHTPNPASREIRPSEPNALPSCPPRRGLFIQAADNHPHKPRSYRVGRPPYDYSSTRSNSEVRENEDAVEK